MATWVVMDPESPPWLPSTPSIPYNNADNLDTYYTCSTSCEDYPLYNIEHSILTMSSHGTNPTVPNANSNSQASQFWTVYPSTGALNCLTCKTPHQLPVHRQTISPTIN